MKEDFSRNGAAAQRTPFEIAQALRRCAAA
jgi:hypothetical protein